MTKELYCMYQDKYIMIHKHRDKQAPATSTQLKISFMIQISGSNFHTSLSSCCFVHHWDQCWWVFVKCPLLSQKVIINQTSYHHLWLPTVRLAFSPQSLLKWEYALMRGEWQISSGTPLTRPWIWTQAAEQGWQQPSWAASTAQLSEHKG